MRHKREAITEEEMRKLLRETHVKNMQLELERLPEEKSERVSELGTLIFGDDYRCDFLGINYREPSDEEGTKADYAALMVIVGKSGRKFRASWIPMKYLDYGKSS